MIVLCVIIGISSMKDVKLAVFMYLGILLLNYVIIYFELFHGYHLAPAEMRLDSLESDPMMALGVERAKDIDLMRPFYRD